MVIQRQDIYLFSFFEEGGEGGSLPKSFFFGAQNPLSSGIEKEDLFAANAPLHRHHHSTPEQVGILLSELTCFIPWKRFVASRNSIAHCPGTT